MASGAQLPHSADIIFTTVYRQLARHRRPAMAENAIFVTVVFYFVFHDYLPDTVLMLLYSAAGFCIQVGISKVLIVQICLFTGGASPSPTQ